MPWVGFYGVRYAIWEKLQGLDDGAIGKSWCFAVQQSGIPMVTADLQMTPTLTPILPSSRCRNSCRMFIFAALWDPSWGRSGRWRLVTAADLCTPFTKRVAAACFAEM